MVLWVRRPSAAARAGAARLLTVIVVGVVASAWYQGYLLEQGHKFHAVAGTEATAYPILAGCLLAALRGYRLVGGGAMSPGA